jgi:hypothetical protein
MKNKHKPTKIDGAIRVLKKAVKRIRVKKNKLSSSAITLSQLSKLERDYITLLRRMGKMLRLPAFKKFHKEALIIKAELDDDLSEIRRKYIIALSEAYKYNIDADEVLDMPEYADFNFSIQNLVFKKIVGDIIPEHPKDEFKRTRSLKRHFVIHAGETNTGKTYHALKALESAETGVYLAPLRLLALQVFQTLNDNGTLCTLSTGEEDIIIPGAKHISSTIEKLDLEEVYDIAVIDEAQMISDKQRGSAWTKAILGVISKEVHICCSLNAVNLLIQLITDCGDSYEVLKYNRDTDLVFDKANFAFPENVKRGDALIVFSKRMVLGISSRLAEKGRNASVIYGDLPPETRRKQMKMFADGETDVVVTTDAIGMGLNLPIKRVVFMETQKYDGEGNRPLFVSEIKQISGRAGRKNIYNTGYVNSVADRSYISESLEVQLPDLSKAYYIPLEKYVLSLPMGTLEERLLCCMDARSGIEYIHKADIEQPLKLLRMIARERLPLTNEQLCRLIFIPFDESNTTLLMQWYDYIKRYVSNDYFSVPELRFETLENLELYYKRLDLYYSFCKNMSIEFNRDEVMRLKYQTSEKIHDLLRTNITTMSRKCRRCSEELEWNFRYNICDKCYVPGFFK